MFSVIPSINYVSCVCVQIRRQAIKELPRFATGENIFRVADILTQLLQTGTRLVCVTQSSVCQKNEQL